MNENHFDVFDIIKPTGVFFNYLCWSVPSSFAHCIFFWFPGFPSGFFQCRTCTHSSSPDTYLFGPPVTSVCSSLWSNLVAGLIVSQRLTNLAVSSWFLESPRFAYLSDGLELLSIQPAQSYKSAFSAKSLFFISFHKRQDPYLTSFCNDAHSTDSPVIRTVP